MTEPPNLPPRRSQRTSDPVAHQPAHAVPAGDQKVKKKGGVAKWLLPLLILGLVGGAYIAKTQMDAKAEEAAAKRLKEMGLILSKRNDHISTISLVTIRDQAQFDEAIALLPDLKGLEFINLKGTLVKDKDMVHVGKVKSAVTLDMSETNVTDKGLAHITSMGNLEALYLSGTGATNALLPSIAKLKKLRIIEMSQGDITGGLGPLASLPQLDWLVLRGIHIKDGSLAELGKSKSIKRLTLNDTTIDDAESLQTFRSLMKKIAIDEDNMVIGSGNEPEESSDADDAKEVVDAADTSEAE